MLAREHLPHLLLPLSLHQPGCRRAYAEDEEHDGCLEESSLIPSGKHPKSKDCRRLVPDSVSTARSHAKRVLAGCEAGIIRPPPASHVAPFRIFTVELVAELDAIGHRERGGRVIDLEVPAVGADRDRARDWPFVFIHPDGLNENRWRDGPR